MSTIADYSVFTKAFLASNNVDFSKPYTTVQIPGGSGEALESLRAFAVVPLDLSTPLTTREALNLGQSIWEDVYGNIEGRISCRDADGNFIGNIVRIQPGKREGSIRLVAKVAVPAASEGNVEDIKVTTFVLLRADSPTKVDADSPTKVVLPIAVATISDGYRLHKHLASGNDPLDDVENANYVSFTINHLNGYTSVDFNPDAYATYDDVENALSRGIDGLHIAFDKASGDLKLLDKNGNVLDQANLPIKTDVIIAEGEEGYKYVKTDVKQDIHAAKAWMPEGKTAWEAVPKALYKMQHAALVVGNASTPASRVFVSNKPFLESPISTESVQFDHVVIGESTYLLVNKTDTECRLRKVKGNAEQIEISAVISEGKVKLNDSQQSYPITNAAVEVDVIEYKGVTHVLVGPDSSRKFYAQPISGERAGQSGNAGYGFIVTFGGSTTSSRVFVDPNSGSYPISTESVQFEHVVTDGSTYMLVDKNGTKCNLIKVKGKAEAQTEIRDAGLSERTVTFSGNSCDIKNEPVEVDVIKDKDGVTYVLAGISNSNEFRALPIGGSDRVQYGNIVTSEGSSTGVVLGIAIKGDGDVKTMYTFDETAESHSEITSISGEKVRWLDTKPLTEGASLKYGLEAFVWTVKDREVKLDEPFFQKLNNSLLDLGFHEGDDIALGTNLATLAPAGGGSPLDGVDADEYIHGKDNKAIRERDVNTQRTNAKEELVAWNAQHPALTEDREHGTIIDSTGLDVRDGRITLGCGRVGAEGDHFFKKINYGIQMKDRSSDPNFPDISESLDFTISHFTGSKVSFNENGHATDLHSSTLLSIAANRYISGAPTCLILAEVTHNSNPNSEGGPVVFAPVRTTAGFSVEPNYHASSGLTLTIHDDRDNILSLLNPGLEAQWSVPAIIEVQAIYMHPNAETVPAQQMHTYIGEWTSSSADIQIGHPECRFLCNKIEEWMMAVGLADTNPNPDTNPDPFTEGVKLYVVIRVY